MKEIKLPELAVRSVYYGGYHAKVAFSNIKTDHVNYKILKAMDIHPDYTRGYRGGLMSVGGAISY